MIPVNTVLHSNLFLLPENWLTEVLKRLILVILSLVSHPFLLMESKSEQPYQKRFFTQDLELFCL